MGYFLAGTLDESASKHYAVYVLPSTTEQQTIEDLAAASSRLGLRATTAPTIFKQRDYLGIKKQPAKKRTYGEDKKEMTLQPTQITERISTAHVNLLNPRLVPSKFDKSGSLRFEKSEDGLFNTRIPKRKARVISHSLSPRDSTARPFVTSMINRRPIKDAGTTSLTTMMEDLSITPGPEIEVREIRPLYKSSSNVTLGHPELALYGEDIDIQRAILEKEIFDYSPNNRPSKLVQVFSPRLRTFKKMSRGEADKLAFKAKDIAKRRRKLMKVRE